MSEPAGGPGPVGRRRVWLLVLLGVAVFAALRGAAVLVPPPAETAVLTEPVVVVGVVGRPQLTDTDRTVLGAHLDDAQVGAVAVRPRYVGRCAANGWATLGAGRRTDVGGRCDPQVAGSRVQDWSGYLAAAAANRGDARLGTLAASVPGCVAAVGPGAALAAARPDGTVAQYGAVDSLLGGGLSCPITLVDAGPRTDEVITALAARDDITVIVTGIGPAPGRDDPALQLSYRLGGTVPGYLTSESTRRPGVTTLTDLTRTLVEFGRSGRAGPPVPVDGSPLQVRPAALTLPAIENHLRAVAALSAAVVPVYWGVAVAAGLLCAVLLTALATRRYALAEGLLTFGTVGLAALMLSGAVSWSRAAHPALALGLTVLVWSVVLTVAAGALGRRLGVPAAVAGAGLTVAAFTVDAALGGVMQPGSVLNSRPVFALRWYGFGNVTFAAYAAAALLLAGYLAHRLLADGRRTAALVTVAAIGFGVVVCEGWPTMGADFGGVIALTPAVLGLLLAVSGVRMTPVRLLLLGAAGVVAVAAVSVLDWLRGPDARSHLGDFVQRVLDGDAAAVVARKAVASYQTVVSPAGLITLVLGIIAWIVIFRLGVPRLAGAFTTLRPTALAVLAVAVLGTLLNDAGISVWIVATGTMAMAVAWFWVHGLRTRGAGKPPSSPAG